MKNNFVFHVEGKGTFGVQAGIGMVEAGIMTGDLGSFVWNNRDGGFTRAGDGKGHNFIGAVAGIKGLGANAKLDYVTNDWIHSAGDLLDYYPNNGALNTEFGLGPKFSKKNSDLVLPSRPDVKVGVNSAANEACNYCLNLSIGAKLLIGIDGSIKIGFTN